MAITHHKALHIERTAAVAGTLTVSGALVVGGSIYAMAGLKTLGTAGTGVVPTTKALSSSRIQLTPIGVTGKAINAWVSTIATGTSFTIKLNRIQTSGTYVGVTGRVAWSIINV